MGTWTRWVAAVGFAIGLLLRGAGIAAACETVQGQLPDPVPRFRLVFVGRVVDVERDGYPVAYVIRVDLVIHGSLETGLHRFAISDGCRPIQAEPGARVLWALTEPSDLTEWNTAAWRLEPDGARTTLLTPWRDWYPFPEQMSRTDLARFVRANATSPATATDAPTQPVIPAGDTGAAILAAAAVGGALSLARPGPAAARRRRRA